MSDSKFLPGPRASAFGRAVAGAGVLSLSLILSLATGCRSIPESESGAPAAALAERMLAATNYAAWTDRTAAVEFRWSGNGKERAYVWDKRRRLVQVEWAEFRVQYNLNNFNSLVWQGGVRVDDPEARRVALESANAAFVNDAFWLNPLFHIKAEAVRYGRVVDDGQESLLVTFASGGVTPGDTYLFIPGADGLPAEIRMWVQSLPIKGATATFGGYQTSATGVKHPTDNSILGVSIQVGDVRMYAAYPPPGASDPFGELAGLR